MALLNADDMHHAWATRLVPELRGPWLTAEACISESVFLLQQAGRAAVEGLLSWLERGLLISQHFLPEEQDAVRSELFAYRRRWVDFADACLVRMSDRSPRLPVVSIDARDFSVYFRRRPGRKLIVPARTAR